MYQKFLATNNIFSIAQIHNVILTTKQYDIIEIITILAKFNSINKLQMKNLFDAFVTYINTCNFESHIKPFESHINVSENSDDFITLSIGNGILICKQNFWNSEQEIQIVLNNYLIQTSIVNIFTI
jgi:hypothetical protein